MIKTLPRPSYMPKYRPRSYKSLSDSGIDTDEELTDSETGIDCDADPSTAIPAGTIIRIENEYMTVSVSAPNVLTVVRGTHGSTAMTHTTNQDIYKVVKGDCVLYLEGQQDPQSSTIRDLSGYNNHGTITGATRVRLPSGVWVNSFDGTDDKISMGAPASLEITTAITLMIWVNPTNVTENIWLMGKGDSDVSYSIRYNWNKFQLTIASMADADNYLQVATATINTWYLYTGTFNGTNLSIYKNGGIVGTKDVTLRTIGVIAQTVNIGTTHSASWDFTGKAGLARIFNTALSATQIAGIFNQERTLFGI